MEEHIGEAPIIIGHSFGSLIALELARDLRARGDGIDAKGVAMLNCGVGMNNKNALKVEQWREQQLAMGKQVEPPAPGWTIALFGLVLSIVDAIFNQKWLLTLLLQRFATADNVRGALQGSVYSNAERVDEPLVQDYLALAANQDAAVEVLRQIYTNDGGPLPFPAAEELPTDFPILTIWGDTDNLAPITGPVGRFFRARAQLLEKSEFHEIAECGHVPQDDCPDVVNAILGAWLVAV